MSPHSPRALLHPLPPPGRVLLLLTYDQQAYYCLSNFLKRALISELTRSLARSLTRWRSVSEDAYSCRAQPRRRHGTAGIEV